MISYQAAVQAIEESGRRALARRESAGNDFTRVDLLDSVGCYLSEDLCSAEDVPGFTNSAMDGFVVSARSTVGATRLAPIEFQVRGMIAAGDDPTKLPASEEGARPI
ncbi:MAG: hypothetical protein AAB425_13040, partial [Bdellovibrionota bacterium]